MIIGLSGKAGAGKDCVAEILVSRYGFVRVGLADPMKRFCKELFGFSDDQLWGPSHCRNAEDARWKQPSSEPLTPRHALQTLGTEWGRSCSADVWVKYAMGIAERLLVGPDRLSIAYTEKLGWYYDRVRNAPVPGVVIPDVRFLNEADIIRRGGGSVVRVTRNGSGLKGEAADHLSERELNDMANEFFDGTIHNHGSKDELAASVEIILGLLKEAALNA